MSCRGNYENLRALELLAFKITLFFTFSRYSRVNDIASQTYFHSLHNFLFKKIVLNYMLFRFVISDFFINMVVSFFHSTFVHQNHSERTWTRVNIWWQFDNIYVFLLELPYYLFAKGMAQLTKVKLIWN